MSSEDVVNNIINKVVEGLRKRYVGIQKYSFHLHDGGGVRRVPDSSGNWIEMSQGHELFDAEVVRSVIEENKIDLSGLMVPVATYAGVEFSRYVLDWENGAMPEGTVLYAPKSIVDKQRISDPHQLQGMIPTVEQAQRIGELIRKHPELESNLAEMNLSSAVEKELIPMEEVQPEGDHDLPRPGTEGREHA